MDASGFTNRLARETSPYLLQHARNPVDWYPWGEEALTAAREQDKPIFLSIGYSACHWCHVMEHESFENAEIAQLMNQRFINIKVDREERPDLDQIYMSAVVALTGSGGWPMSVFLTPDTRPFFGGTYWPPVARYGRPGFREVLSAVYDAWESRRDAVVQQAGELTQAISAHAEPEVSLDRLSLETLRHAQDALVRAADRTHGGFGRAPKFPHPADLRVLMRCHRRFGSRDALDVVTLTLDKMARGGIYDHLGGGFARYSTDERWLVPHFEKMLYDNAQLAVVYLEAFQLTGREDYAGIVRHTLDYVLREMTQPGGGFYSTQDADSEGVEGKFFVWSKTEVMSVLGPDDGPLFCRAYDVTEHGNWEHANILNLKQSWEQIAKVENLDRTELEPRLARCRSLLLQEREKRVWPGRDDKVLVNWNGLMITALAQAALTLREPRYSEAAVSAAEFILREMRTSDGRLWHAYKDGKARFNAYLDDYAALIEGLTELAQAVAEPRYLEIATELADHMLARFWDRGDAGFYFTSEDHESLIARTKDIHDNATPSGNSLAAMALLKLGRLCGREDYEQRAASTLDLMTGTLQRVPQAAGQALIAFDFLLGPTYEIIVCPGGEGASGAETRSLASQEFVPNRVLMERPPNLPDSALSETLKPLLSGKIAVNGRTTVYICENGTCQQPVSDAEIEAAFCRLASEFGA